MDFENCTAYRLIEKKELKELNSIGYLAEHKKTRARVVLVENDDNNKVFAIGFRTPPKDSTGVAHIVEHTVLCGSREFPVKDPFIELSKGSLNTFLNAMTYPDKTVYPVASCNDKDFQNLMHVYLDAVFYPNIYKEEKIFRQEGWHYEMESADGDIKYNGVVFNEMKGVFSSPDEQLSRQIQKSLFPETAYGVESGGDPVDIPDLTWEEYLDFHRRYYHPSNSYIYLYGDMDMAEKLNWIDEHYLKDFDYLEVDSRVRKQVAFEKMEETHDYYSVMEGESTEGKTYMSYSAVCGDSMDRNLYQAFSVLEYVLIQSVGAPVKQALLDAGIGTEITGGYEESICQPYFSVTAKNVDTEKKEDFLEIIRGTLSELADKGINEKSLRAAINATEFQYREADFGMYPKGLMYGLQMFDSWLYDDTKPFIHVCADDTFEFLKKQVGTGYYEGLIRTYLLDNTHSSLVVVEPKEGLTVSMDEAERERLRKYRDTLSGEERRELVRKTEELKAYQEEPTPPEMLKCIPMLTREDLGKKAQPFHNEKKEPAGISALHHRIFTNGINYIRLAFDVTDLKEYAPYLALLTMIGTVDTDKYDKLELSNEVLLHAGGYSTNASVYNDNKSDDYVIKLEVAVKTLYKETGYVLGLLRDILTTSHVWDEKRLREIIGERRSSCQASLQHAGHQTAINRAKSYLGSGRYYSEQLKGIGYYDFLCDLDENFDERKENLISVLTGLMKTVFARERLLISITSDDEGYSIMEENIRELSDGLPEKSPAVSVQPFWTLPPVTKNEGFETAGKVQYVARVGKFADKGISYRGTNRVIRTILNYDYLWNEVRVKGGAYGVMSSFGREGVGYMVSYRDPNLAETNAVYCGIPEYLSNFRADERDMMKYIIGTVSELDTPLTPRTKGYRSYNAWLTGMSEEDVQRERDEVLATGCGDIRDAAKLVEAVLSDGYICALGGEEKIKEASDLFDEIKILK